MMGDPTREFTTALDVEMNHPGPPSVGIVNHSKRCAFHVVDGAFECSFNSSLSCNIKDYKITM